MIRHCLHVEREREDERSYAYELLRERRKEQREEYENLRGVGETGSDEDRNGETKVVRRKTSRVLRR